MAAAHTPATPAATTTTAPQEYVVKHTMLGAYPEGQRVQASELGDSANVRRLLKLGAIARPDAEDADAATDDVLERAQNATGADSVGTAGGDSDANA